MRSSGGGTSVANGYDAYQKLGGLKSWGTEPHENERCQVHRECTPGPNACQ